MIGKDKIEKRNFLPWALWACGILTCTSAYFWLPALLSSALEGRSLSHLNQLVARHHLKAPELRTHQFYRQLAEDFTLRFVFLFSLLGGLSVCLLTIWRAQVCSFFFTPSSPVNLAIFRVVVFATALNFPLWSQLQLFTAPYSSLDLPPVWSSILGPDLWSPDFNQLMIVGFQVACLLALIGFKTRVTTLAATLLGLFVLGIPQFFGKINHYHHLWAFMLYCAASPSGDALSIDAFRFKEASLPSWKYRWPLAWAGVTIGILYFYPGVWKVLISGSDWVFSDNLQNKMYAKWFESGFRPVFRIDHYPWLLRIGALHTIAFEILFVFALFHKYTRWLAIASALVFHHFTLLFMGIYFDTLVPMFVCFVNWPKILRLKVHTPADCWRHGDLKNTHWIPAIYFTLMLLSGAILFDTWPIGTYPTFASLEKPYIKSVFIQQIDKTTGKVVQEFVPLKNELSLAAFSFSGNLQSFMMNMSSTKDPIRRQMMAKSLLSSLQLKPSKGFSYRFFLGDFSTLPDSPPPVYSQESAKLIVELPMVQ